MLNLSTILTIFVAGWTLMRITGAGDLRKRIPPRLDKFHVQHSSGAIGVTYWSKTKLYQDYCEARNGYICQRPAAAGAASEAKGTVMDSPPTIEV